MTTPSSIWLMTLASSAARDFSAAKAAVARRSALTRFETSERIRIRSPRPSVCSVTGQMVTSQNFCPASPEPSPAPSSLLSLSGRP